MDDKTLIALKESIAKWEKRASGDHCHPVGSIGCPLCKLFHTNFVDIPAEDCCLGCPVFEKTAGRHCFDTPYYVYLRDRTNQNAQREVDFLKSLLPAEEAREGVKLRFGWVNLSYLK